MLPNSPHVNSVYNDPNGLLSTATPGTLFLDCSTIDPSYAQQVSFFYFVKYGFKMEIFWRRIVNSWNRKIEIFGETFEILLKNCNFWSKIETFQVQSEIFIARGFRTTFFQIGKNWDNSSSQNFYVPTTTIDDKFF